MRSRLAAGVASSVFYCAIACLAVWLLWYGEHQWAGYGCRVKGGQGNHPTGMALSTPCALSWTRPLLEANVGFLFVAPAVAAMAAVAMMGLRQQHRLEEDGVVHRAKAAWRLWGSTLLPPRAFWLWLCDGLTVTDALMIVVWAAYNAVWYFTIVTKAPARVPPGAPPPPRFYARSFATLMMPNVVPLMLPVARGSAISNALGMSYPEGIRYHRWLGQWVLLLSCLHGFILWFSWAGNGAWVELALGLGQDTHNLLGSVALICAVVLWLSSQAPFRRRWFSVYKTLHHVCFWGFMVAGVAHHWSLFWYFVPGLILYAVDGVFRLHQTLPGIGANAEVLQVEVNHAATMCTLLLSASRFGAAPAGIVWLNVPSVSWWSWHPFDYTSSAVVVGADGRVRHAHSCRKGDAEGRVKTALAVHIKAYNGWTKALLQKLAQADQKLSIRIQGPYAAPPSDVGQPDAVVVVAGGNGIASALPVLTQLSAAGVSTQGLPALLVWACRKGYEFEHMAAPVLAAARALGLNLTLHLHITDVVNTTHQEGSTGPGNGSAASAAIDVPSLTDTTPFKDQHSTSAQQNDTPVPTTTLTVAAAGSTMSNDTIPMSAAAGSISSGSRPDTPDALVAARPVTHTASTAIEVKTDISAAAAQHAAVPGNDNVVPAAANNSGAEEPNGLCPVVAFTSFAAQLSFKAILHLVVFGGFLLGLYVVSHISSTMQVAAGKAPWGTAHLGPALVLIPAGISVTFGLITLWIGLYIQRNLQDLTPGLAAARGPAAATAAALGRPAKLIPAASEANSGAKSTTASPASVMLQVPTLPGAVESLPVVAERPDVEKLLQGWLVSLQQLPSATTPDNSKAGATMTCIVYGCGPSPLNRATQLVVASFASKQKVRGAGGIRPVRLQFVRKAQAL